MQAGHGKHLRGLEEGARRTQSFGRFGQMFPDLEALEVDDDRLAKLAATMVDVGQSGDNRNIPAGYTYLGQFIDHDITFDTSGLGEKVNDPTAVLNFRSPRLDLDSVYGRGPADQPFLYDRVDPRKLAVGVTGPGGEPRGPGGRRIRAGLPNDLPRSREGLAIIGDPRNDENLLVAQTHLALLKFHNAVVDRIDRAGTANPDQVFEEARRTVRWHYQWLVLHDFLDRLVDFNDVHDVLTNGRKHYLFERQSEYADPYMPVEFSVAAYRLGHSMVREDYSHNRVFRPGAGPSTFSFLFHFSGLSGGIVGERVGEPDIVAKLRLPKLKLADGSEVDPFPLPNLPGDWAIDWNRFYEIGVSKAPPQGAEPPANEFRLNFSRLIDPYLVPALHDLPGGGGNLAHRNLQRGVKMHLPSGQAVAGAMGIAPLTPAEIASSGPDGAKAKELGLHEKTPLWYYILKEAQLRGDGGNRLAGVGSRILAEVFVGLLEGDCESYLRQDRNWKPALPSQHAGTFTMPDLLRFVGDLDPVNEPTSFE
ncbi:peroxidase family protein [Falsiroseomonas sp.]|uniref:peroxidase family protein n=1 Tax=Falsiroseomonas sp. TaxID=2870721 RepID=UPI003565110D